MNSPTTKPAREAAGEPALDPVACLRAADPVLRAMIDAVGPDSLGDPRAGRPDDHYGALVRSIVGQQLSTKAARAIFLRLTERFGGRTPTPREVLDDDPEELRAAAGLSRAKVGFLRSLAEHVGCAPHRRPRDSPRDHDSLRP